MKILIGVDDSPHSSAAVQFVKSMTWPKGTRVLVVSAMPVAVGFYAEAYVPAGRGAITEDMIEFHEEIASNAERALRGAGFETEARVLDGDPRAVLVDTARTEHADLLIVGSHGRTGMSKLLMGSVASHVVAHAPCSVLVVKGPNPTR